MTGGDPFALPIDGTLDLHAFSPRDVKSVVQEYVTEAHARGLTEIRIIHGRGTGVLRGVVQAALEAHPLVEAFWDDTAAHLGATGAKLGTRDSGFGTRGRARGPAATKPREEDGQPDHCVVGREARGTRR